MQSQPTNNRSSTTIHQSLIPKHNFILATPPKWFEFYLFGATYMHRRRCEFRGVREFGYKQPVMNHNSLKFDLQIEFNSCKPQKRLDFYLFGAAYTHRWRCGFGGSFKSSIDIPTVMQFPVFSPPNPYPTEVCGDGWNRGSRFRVWVLIWVVVLGLELGLDLGSYETVKHMAHGIGIR